MSAFKDLQEGKLPWIKWEPEKFLNGISRLSAVEIGVYVVLLNAIYDNEGPLPHDERRLARMCGGLRLDQFKKVLQALVDQGKIILAEGYLSNPKADRELDRRKTAVANLRANSAKGGEVTKQKAKGNNAGEGAKATAGRAVDSESDIDSSLRSEAPPAQPRPKGNGELKHNSSRGTRMPRDWKVDNEQMLWARHQGLTEKEASYLAKRFVAHYLSAPNSNPGSRAADWNARWQSWVLKQAMDLGRDVTAPKSPQDASPEAIATALSRDDWEKLVESFRMTGRWNPRYGPEPGRPGFLGPTKLVNAS